MTTRAQYHYEPIVPEATQQVHCVTEGCNFRADVGPDGKHGHDSRHDVVLLPVDYKDHPLFEVTNARVRDLRDAKRKRDDRGPRGVSGVSP